VILAEADLPEFLTVAEVASLLRISKTAIYRLLEMGLLPHVRLGKGKRSPIRTRRSTLLKFCTEREQKSLRR
jgi:excisionase family DNA binding protein